MSDTQTLGTNLIAHAPDAIILADCDGVIRLWNRAAEAMFGYGAAEAIGQTLDLIVPEPYRVAHWAGFSRAVEQGRFAKNEVLLTSRALTKDGRIITVEFAAAIVRNPSGEVQGIIAIGRDATERRVREQAQLERIASLERQVTALAVSTAGAGEGESRRDRVAPAGASEPTT
jgi:PAS domain S-box-containing protein